MGEAEAVPLLAQAERINTESAKIVTKVREVFFMFYLQNSVLTTNVHPQEQAANFSNFANSFNHSRELAKLAAKDLNGASLNLLIQRHNTKNVPRL